MRCSKRYVHDWRTCPFSHPTENARRRDPREHRYLAVPCPEYKKGICLLGDTCPYAHGVYECWLHPCKYRTQLCKDGEACRRPVCFFAHSQRDLRQAVTDFNPTSEDLERCERVRAGQPVAPVLPPVRADVGVLTTAVSDFAAPAAGGRPIAGANALLQSTFSAAPGCMGSLSSSPTRPAAIVGSHRPSTESAIDLPVAPILLSDAGQAVAGSPPGCSSPTSTRSSADMLDAASVGRASFDSQGALSGPRMSNALSRKLGLAPSRDSKGCRASAPSVQRRSASLDYNAPLDYNPEQTYLATQRAAAGSMAALGTAAPTAALPPTVPLAATPAAPVALVHGQLQQLAQLVSSVPQDVYPQYALPPASSGPASPQQMQALINLVASLKTLNVAIPSPIDPATVAASHLHSNTALLSAGLPLMPGGLPAVPGVAPKHPSLHAAQFGLPTETAALQMDYPGAAMAAAVHAAAQVQLHHPGVAPQGMYHLPQDLQAYLTTDHHSAYF